MSPSSRSAAQPAQAGRSLTKLGESVRASRAREGNERGKRSKERRAILAGTKRKITTAGGSAEQRQRSSNQDAFAVEGAGEPGARARLSA